MLLRIRWTTQVCTSAFGQIEPIASGRPGRPSQHTSGPLRAALVRGSADLDRRFGVDQVLQAGLEHPPEHVRVSELRVRADSARKRITLSIVTVGATAGFFGDPLREGIIGGGSCCSSGSRACGFHDHSWLFGHLVGVMG